MSSSRNDFQKKLHSKFNTSFNLLNSIILKASGSDIASMKKIIRGESNEVYEVLTKNNKHLFIRISRKNDNRLFFEKWAINQAKKMGVPVPEIIYLDEINNIGENISVSVEIKIEGTPLDILLNKNENYAWMKNILNNAGEILSKIHKIKTGGFGDLDVNGNSMDKNLKNSILKKEDDIKTFKDIADKVGLPINTIDTIFKVFKEHQSLLDNKFPILIHNDYSPQHILIKDNKITGILDWEVARGGDPLQDFARWEFYYGDRYPTSLLRQGYKNQIVFDDHYEEKIHLFKLYKELILLYYHYQMIDTKGLEFVKNKILEDLIYFNIKL